jgi:hypothetical protein
MKAISDLNMYVEPERQLVVIYIYKASGEIITITNIDGGSE